MPSWTRTCAPALTALALAGALAGCSDPVDAVIDFALEGTFQDMDGLVVEFADDEARIVDFGDSPLGTNPGVLGVGDAFITGIECDAVSCTGEVVDPVFVDEVLESYDMTGVEIERDGDQLTLRSTAFEGGVSLLSPADEDEEPGTPGDGTLTASASCAEWWAAVTEVGTWQLTYINDRINYQGSPPEEVTFTFSGAGEYAISNPAAIGLAKPTGTVEFDEKIFGTDYCRFRLHDSDDFQVKVFFPHSLEGGTMRFNLASDHALDWWEFEAN